jgi:cysteine-rich repeat protein
LITASFYLTGAMGAACSEGGEAGGTAGSAAVDGGGTGGIGAMGGAAGEATGGTGGTGGTGPVGECTPGPDGDDSCSDFRPCNGQERCMPDGTCAPAEAPLARGTSCGEFRVCIDGVCVETPSECGDELVGPTEECDDANQASGDGCENDCRFTCLSTDPTRNCTPLDPCEGNGVCNETTHVCAPGTPLPDGTICDTGKVCIAGACTTPCVDGVHDTATGEECDDGNLVNGDGCDNDCRFSCVSTDTSRDCSPADICEGPSTCDDSTHVCSSRTPLANGTSCDTNKTCYTGACCGPTDTVCQTPCDLTGTWGVKIVTNVNWALRYDITQPGSGEIVSWGKIDRTMSGTTVTDRTTACGLTIPDFSADLPWGFETYGLSFPNAIFDNNTLPRVTVRGTLSSLRQGAAFTAPSMATLLGMDNVPNPETWPWPEECDDTCLSTQFESFLADHDQDGKPGITALPKTGAGYELPPTGSLAPPPRVDAVYLAVRQVAALSGTLVNCGEIIGLAGVTAQDSRILSCRNQADGTDCESPARNILDFTKPLHRPTTATFQMKKLSSTANCAIVRSTLP